MIPVPAAWRDLRVRVASALVIAPIGLAALWWGGVAWNALIVVLALGMAMEWASLCAAARVGEVPRTLSGLLYIGPASVALIWMRGAADVGLANVLFIVLVVWASDIGAYLCGRLVGGPKLAPAISPGKTWSGAAGGLLGVAVVGVIASLLTPGGHVLHGAMVAAGLGVASQLGDLLESGLKRYFGVKDSGQLIPGHGGLLDRLDGMLLAVPVAAILVLVQGRGVTLWQ
jgi:phosphatidate cytidylyltransferase